MADEAIKLMVETLRFCASPHPSALTAKEVLDARARAARTALETYERANEEAKL